MESFVESTSFSCDGVGGCVSVCCFCCRENSPRTKPAVLFICLLPTCQSTRAPKAFNCWSDMRALLSSEFSKQGQNNPNRRKEKIGPVILQRIASGYDKPGNAILAPIVKPRTKKPKNNKTEAAPPPLHPLHRPIIESHRCRTISRTPSLRSNPSPSSKR